MVKTKILVLVLTLLMSATLLPAAMAKVQKPTLTFSATAAGECLVAPVLGPTTEPFFLGKGMIAVCGSAYATANDPGPGIPVPYYVTDAGVKALGVVSVQWADQRIDVAFCSSAAQGVFVDKEPFSDVLVVGGLPGVALDPSSALSYYGWIKDSAGTRAVSGKAVALAAPLGTSDPLIGVMLFKSDGSSLKVILWSPVTGDVIPGMTLHAANIFMKSVKINN